MKFEFEILTCENNLVCGHLVLKSLKRKIRCDDDRFALFKTVEDELNDRFAKWKCKLERYDVKRYGVATLDVSDL